MTVLEVVQRAVLKLGMRVPDQVFAATGREMVEMAAMVNDVAETIRDAFDWQALTSTTTFTGNGVAESFGAPADYARMLKNGKLFTSRQPNTALRHVLNANEWLAQQVENFDPAFGSWTLQGGSFRFRPVLSNGEVVSLAYIRNALVQPATGNAKALFTADTDSFVLPENLLRLGIIWNWKAAKAQPYAKELEDYEVALDKAAGDDRGNRILTIGARRTSLDAVYAFPYPIVP